MHQSGLRREDGKSRDFDERIEFVTDPDAEPTDWDEALAVFLLAFIRKRNSTFSGSSMLERPNDNEK
jgi:hypothetical protein